MTPKAVAAEEQIVTTVVDATAQAPGMPGCPRRGPGRPRSEEAERAILDAALEELALRGIGGLSIEAVAQRAGVAKTTVYRRWANKNDLIVAALATAKGPVVYPPAGGSVRDDLLYLMQHVAKSWRRAPEAEIFARLMAESNQHPELMKSYWEQVISPRREVSHGVLRRGIAEGVIRADADIKLMMEMLMSPIAMAALNWCAGTQFTDAQVEKLVDTVLAGWAPPC